MAKIYSKIKERKLDEIEQKMEGDNLKLATFGQFYRYYKGNGKHFDYLKEEKKMLDLISKENIVDAKILRSFKDETIKNKKITYENFNFFTHMLLKNFISYSKKCNDYDLKKNFTNDALKIYNKLLLKVENNKTIYPGIMEDHIKETTKELKEILEKINETEYKKDIEKLDTNLSKFESNTLSLLDESLDEEVGSFLTYGYGGMSWI